MEVSPGSSGGTILTVDGMTYSVQKTFQAQTRMDLQAQALDRAMDMIVDNLAAPRVPLQPPLNPRSQKQAMYLMIFLLSLVASLVTLFILIRQYLPF
ncbi:alternative larget T antigen [Rhinolophus simulator polyomavirus 1]|uniref:alternative larget T antigen n=1 Tax=Rhinolophus simulator polyomavirus 1 TaxID=2029304 RepID=UPI000B60CE99|nr:alternative larget T antigen [Rhinolophus simulator polyomavirus 1]BAZ96587.1 alternative larget T antigen [Rhinolophus simulator polyomavirus 1]